MSMKEILIIFSITLLLTAGIAEAQVNSTQASQYIKQAENQIEELEGNGFGTAFLKDTLLDAKNSMKLGEYESVLEKTQLISERRKIAFNISDSLKALEIGKEEHEFEQVRKREIYQVDSKCPDKGQSQDYKYVDWPQVL